MFGGEKANVLASLLSHLATVEYDKKILGRETLEKYKEITLIYDSAEKLAASLDPKEVAQLVVDEVKKVIKADYVSIMLMNEETSIFEILAAAGKEYYPKVSLRAGEGIVGCVVLTGKAEIVNDVFSDSRYVVRVYYDKLFEAGDNGNA
ncbi:MAG: hypothetical protein A4E52_01519 [Pelotomaculum sp. PtaB.Bin013]|nr:MAG: hypothetical protein A4E52_01519 [Pelotomaculum sp. PtaB.Bin013]